MNAGRSQHQSQLSLGPMEVGDSDSSVRSVRNSDDSQGLVRMSDAPAVSASIFDQAIVKAGIERKEVAALVGVSTSLVDKWCDVHADRSPSFTQLLCMPLSFHLALNKVMNRRFGFWRAIARDLFETIGQFAAAVD
jgi:hypothetical protein